MSTKAQPSEGLYNATDANAGVDVDRTEFVEQLKQQLRDLESELAAAHKLLAEIVSPTETAGRNPLFVYYTDCRQEINNLLTRRERLYFLLENNSENDHD